MNTTTATKPADYLHIAAWGRHLGSFAGYIADQQERACDAGAPVDAIYENHAPYGGGPTGVWSTVRDLSAHAREVFDAEVERLRNRK